MSKIKVMINGEEKEIDSNSTIQSILEEMRITNPMVVVERNFEIVPKENYQILIEKGDNLEVVSFVGGG